MSIKMINKFGAFMMVCISASYPFIYRTRKKKELLLGMKSLRQVRN